MRVANQLPVKHLNHSKFPAHLDSHPAPSPLANCCSSLPGEQPPIQMPPQTSHRWSVEVELFQCLPPTQLMGQLLYLFFQPPEIFF